MIAYYMRLSRADDDHREQESNSIQNQRGILQDYQAKHPDLAGEYLEYIDDGYSGSTFKRPGWMRLIEDCKKGRVQTLMVKDTSRLGRNYLGVEDYLQEIFPMLGVRVICVGERYDSKKDQPNVIISMENLVNDYYLKELSLKQKTRIRANWKAGLITNIQTPYGYVCEDVKEGWKIVPDEAEIVRRIFRERIDGKTNSEIARRLNEESIDPPAAFESKPDMPMFWSSRAVGRILANEEYTGVRIVGKRISIKPGEKRIRLTSKSEQIRYEDDHEAIIERKTYDQVNSMKQGRGKIERGTRGYLFKGMVRCAGCGRALEYYPKKYYCRCARESCISNCRREAIQEDVLKEKIWNILLERSRAAKIQLSKLPNGIDTDRMEREILALNEKQAKMYDALLDERITKEEYITFRDDIRGKVDSLKNDLMLAKGTASYIQEAEDSLKPLAAIMEEKELTREILLKVVKMIYVGTDEIHVELKADPFLKEEV